MRIAIAQCDSRKNLVPWNLSTEFRQSVPYGTFTIRPVPLLWYRWLWSLFGLLRSVVDMAFCQFTVPLKLQLYGEASRLSSMRFTQSSSSSSVLMY